MDKQKRYNILNKINALAEGDVYFEQELANLYIHNFKELKEKFATIVTTQNMKELSFLNHKYRTTFMMLDMEDIAKEIEKSKAILSSGTLYIDELNRIIANIEKSCDEVIHELNEKH